MESHQENGIQDDLGKKNGHVAKWECMNRDTGVLYCDASLGSGAVDVNQQQFIVRILHFLDTLW